MTLVQGDYVRVTCNFELGDGTQYQNVYHYLRDGPDVVADATIINNIDARLTLAYAELVTSVPNDVTTKLCYVDQVAWVIDRWKVIANIGTFVLTFSPTDAGESLPYTVSPYVIFKTTRPKSVGKKFLFPFTESWQDSSIILGGALADMAAYAALIIEDVSLGGTSQMIPGIIRTGVEAWLSFQVAVVNDILGSQKRRRPGVGA